MVIVTLMITITVTCWPMFWYFPDFQAGRGWAVHPPYLLWQPGTEGIFLSEMLSAEYTCLTDWKRGTPPKITVLDFISFVIRGEKPCHEALFCPLAQEFWDLIQPRSQFQVCTIYLIYILMSSQHSNISGYSGNLFEVYKICGGKQIGFKNLFGSKLKTTFQAGVGIHDGNPPFHF